MAVPRHRIGIVSALSAGVGGTGGCVVTNNHTCWFPAGMWLARTVTNILGDVLDSVEYSLHNGYILENSHSTRSIYNALVFL